MLYGILMGVWSFEDFSVYFVRGSYNIKVLVMTVDVLGHLHTG